MIRADQLNAVIRKMYHDSKKYKSSKAQMCQMGGGRLLALTVPNENDYQQKYKLLLEEMQEQSKTETVKICPRCGGELVEREGKFGKFIGCISFPKCRYTEKNKPDQAADHADETIGKEIKT